MKKTKKQGFFKNVKNSIFNFDSYQEFAMQDMKKGIFYFLKLSILFSVVISIVFAALQVTVTVPTVKKFIEGDIPNFSYSNGTAVKFNFENLPAEDYKVATVAKGGHHVTVYASFAISIV